MAVAAVALVIGPTVRLRVGNEPAPRADAGVPALSAPAVAPPTWDALLDRAGAASSAAGAGGLGAVDRLWTNGSLRGTALDGDWGRWSADQLQPSFGLRRRFDHLLSGQGEVALDALRRWVAAQVAVEHGPAGAAQVLEVWDRYLQVQPAAYTVSADPRDRSTWQPALAEHSRIRRQLLGSAWAEAFFGAEERELAAEAQRQPASGGGAAADPTDALLAASARSASDAAEATGLHAARAARFGVAAADRLQANDAAWLAWQQRIEAARAAWSTIQNDVALSAPQREAAARRLLAERFDPGEQVRARGLVLLPGTGAPRLP